MEEEEAEAEAPQPKSKSPSANPPKLALKFHLLIFTMAKSSSTNITEPDAAKNAMVKEVKMLKGMQRPKGFAEKENN